MVEDGTRERILKIFKSGADAVKTYEEILEGLADKDLDETTLEVSTWDTINDTTTFVFLKFTDCSK